MADAAAVRAGGLTPRARRKEAWARAREAVRGRLLAWLQSHPGEEPDEAILADCRQAVLALVRPAVGTGPRAGLRIAKGPKRKAATPTPSAAGAGHGGASAGGEGTAATVEVPLTAQAAGFVRETYKQLRAKRLFRKARTAEEWAALFPRYPASGRGDGFLRAFDPQDGAGIRSALARFGVCVVQVLTAEECEASVVAMFEEINAMRAARGIRGPAVSPTDPATWAKGNWPNRGKFLVDRVALHPQAFRNRCNPNIYRAFAGVFEEERLHATVDNWGVLRGAAANPRWPAAGLKPHWDLSPWAYLQDVDAGRDPGYQGLVALTDQTLETGCHLTLPGGTRFVRQWCRENAWPASVSRRSHRPAADDPVAAQMQAIPLRRGEMVVWSWGQLHGSTDSHSAAMRLHQFVRLYPAPEAGRAHDYEGLDRYGCERTLRRCLADGDLAAADLDTAVARSALERRLLGLETWV